MKPPKQPREIWSWRSLTGKAQDELSWGFWEENVAGGTNHSGVWQQGVWQQWAQQGKTVQVAKRWIETFRMDEATFEVVYER
jgi:hypothetical protein